MGRRLADGRRWWVCILLLLLATAAAGPLLFNSGFLNTRGGGDSPFLLFRLQQLTSALADGRFPARWMPDAAYGLGYPFFSYYAALPYYLGAALHFWGLGLVAAVKLTQWLGFLLAAWAMWGLVRSLAPANHWAPWLSAVAYTFAPYHLVNVYVRGDSLGEFWAMGLYPLLLWAAVRLWAQPGRGRLVLFALSYAALILTHNISALIFSPFLLLFLLLLILRRGAGSWRWLALGLVLGLALSAFYALPALSEQDAVQLTAQTSGYFHYGGHFRDLAVDHQGKGLVQTGLLFDYEISGRTPFGMGLVQAIVAGAGLVAALLRLRRPGTGASQGLARTVAAFAFLTLLVGTLMITPASRFLWDHVPLLPLVQFPWRFLSVQALAAALLAAWLAPADPPASIGPRLRTLRDLIPSLLILIIAIAALGNLHPDIIALTTADVTPERLQLYEWFSGNIGTTIRYEYLPRAVVPRLYTSEELITGRPMEADVLGGNATAARLEKRTGRERWRVEVQSDSATLAFPTLYWPGWYAKVDGERRPLRPAPSLGTLALELPAGEHDVILVLGRTPVRLAAELISLVALLISLVLLFPLAPRLPEAPRFLLRYGLPLLLVAIVLHLIPTPSPPGNDLTWDFGQQAFLHHNPDGVPFGDAAVMQDYQITRSADGGWQVMVRWAQVSRPDLVAVLSLVHPAQVSQDIPYLLAADRQPLGIGQDQTVFSLPEPEAVPPGPLLPRLELLEADGVIPALTSAGRERGDLFLHPIPAAPPSPAPTIQEEIQLVSAEASPLTPEKLGVTLRWAVGEPVQANWKLALRLRDPAGNEWAALDTQPGYGFYPTGAWQPGTAFSEQLVLAVPYGLAPGEYLLSVSLYDATSLAARWGPQEQVIHLTAAPYDGRPLLHRFSPLLAVASLAAPDAISQGDPLPFMVGWVALGGIDGPVQIRWDLAAPDGAPAASGAGALQIGAGTLVLDRQTLATDPHIPPGSYLLRLSVPGAPAWDAATITVQERTRRFDLPEMDSVLGAQFGGLIRLEGANLAQRQEVLEVTLYWRALSTVPADYIVFVHLFDPATEGILAQHDAMPQNNTYPTSRWAADEVVEDPITLSLSEVPAGRYRLGVGLYWKEGDRYPRLPAFAPDGEPVPGDRVVLPTELTVP
jgi:hypothetical protein